MASEGMPQFADHLTGERLFVALTALHPTLLYFYFRNVWIGLTIHALNDAVGLLLAEQVVESADGAPA